MYQVGHFCEKPYLISDFFLSFAKAVRLTGIIAVEIAN
jgi:hypothetical protein